MVTSHCEKMLHFYRYSSGGWKLLKEITFSKMSPSLIHHLFLFFLNLCRFPRMFPSVISGRRMVRWPGTPATTLTTAISTVMIRACIPTGYRTDQSPEVWTREICIFSKHGSLCDYSTCSALTIIPEETHAYMNPAPWIAIDRVPPF